MRSEKPEAIIEAMYEISELSIAEKKLLSVFAVLPAEAIDFEILEILLDAEQENSVYENLDKILEALSQKGWLEENENTTDFKCSPVIQEIVCKKNEQLFADVEGLISILVEKSDHEGIHITGASYEETVLYVHYAEAVVIAFSTPFCDIAVLCERIGNYYTITGNLEMASMFFEEQTQLFEELYEVSPQNVNFKNGLAVSYANIGEYYRDHIDDKKTARTYFEQCYQLWKALSESYPSYVEFKKNFDEVEGDLEDLKE